MTWTAPPRARPIQDTLLYQFHGALFFASIDDFEEDILYAADTDTRLVIVTGVTSVDMFAAERLLHFYRKLKSRDIRFILVGHSSAVNEQLIAYGAEDLITHGAVRQRLTQALSSGGLEKPYLLDSHWIEQNAGTKPEAFEWAYGKYARERLEAMARKLSDSILSEGGFEPERFQLARQELAGDYWNREDEEEFLDQMEMSLASAVSERGGSEEAFHALARALLDRRVHLEWELLQSDEADAQAFLRQRLLRKQAFQMLHPDAWTMMEDLRLQYMEELRETQPEIAVVVEDFAKRVKTEAPVS